MKRQGLCMNSISVIGVAHFQSDCKPCSDCLTPSPGMGPKSRVRTFEHPGVAWLCFDATIKCYFRIGWLGFSLAFKPLPRKANIFLKISMLLFNLTLL